MRSILALSLITLVSNASFSTIAPILPLECDSYDISERSLSLIFLAYPVGFCVASPLITKLFEDMGTVNIMILGMGVEGAIFLSMSFVFTYAPSNMLVLLLTAGQFLIGTSMSAISTGYYSLSTFVFSNHEAALSYIESAVGIGYITGPLLGSTLYERFGYKGAYCGVSGTMFMMAFITYKYLTTHLSCENREREEEQDGDLLGIEVKNQLDDISSDNIQRNYCNDVQSNFRCKDNYNVEKNCVNANQIDISQMEAQREEKITVNDLTTSSLIKHPKITCAAMSIMWVSASWCFLEPILAKRLVHFDLSKSEIGFMFALSNLVYVPTAFCIQYIPSKYIEKHTTIAMSLLLTPVGVFLVGSDSLSMITLGILLLGLFPTPVWIYLLPSMQEGALTLFSNQNHKRCNDLTAGIYNLFITLGQIVGYIIGPLLNQSYGVTATTRIVAVFILIQMVVYCCGVGMFNSRSNWQRKGRRKGRYFARYIL